MTVGNQPGERGHEEGRLAGGLAGRRASKTQGEDDHEGS